jgi:hypothetical protein
LRTKDHETKTKQGQKNSIKNSASLTAVQGPSTVACMIVTSLSQLPHWLHQLPTMGKGQWKQITCIPSFCCKSRSNRKTQPCYWLATNNNAWR